MKAADRARLEHIVDAVETILGYANQRFNPGIDRKMMLQGILYNIAVIGEAVAHLDEETKALSPGLPWSKTKGMRNVVVHQYFAINQDEVWATVDDNIEILGEAVRRMLGSGEDRQ